MGNRKNTLEITTSVVYVPKQLEFHFNEPMSRKSLCDLDRQFYQDACILEEALDREKGLPRVSSSGRQQQHHQKVQNGNVIVESAELVNQNAAQLTNKAKELRGTTVSTFNDIISHWQKQTNELQKELEVYRNKSNTTHERVEKRTAEIENLRVDNARIAGLLEQCDVRINEMINEKSQEKQERQRAQHLSDQVYDAKKMKVHLKQRLVDAERLLVQTRGEKRALLEENQILKGATAELRHKLKESTNDTRQTKQELEELEQMIRNAEQPKTPVKSPSKLSRVWSAIFGDSSDTSLWE